MRKERPEKAKYLSKYEVIAEGAERDTRINETEQQLWNERLAKTTHRSFTAF